MPRRRRALLRGPWLSGADDGDDAIDARIHARAEAVLPKERRDVLGDDPPRRNVGQHAFEAVADLDTHLAIVFGDDEQRAVVLAFAADLPRLGNARWPTRSAAARGTVNDELIDVRSVRQLPRARPRIAARAFA